MPSRDAGTCFGVERYNLVITSLSIIKGFADASHLAHHGYSLNILTSSINSGLLCASTFVRPYAFGFDALLIITVEMVRFELMTPCLQGRCSPN